LDFIDYYYDWYNLVDTPLPKYGHTVCNVLQNRTGFDLANL